MPRLGSPIGPFFVALFGGVLMMSNGIVTFVVATPQLYPGSGAWIGVVGSGTAGILTGVVVVALSGLLVIDSSRPASVGLAIIAFSLVSYLGGGGFFLGLILGVLGGIWTLYLLPSGEGRDAAAKNPELPRAQDRQCPQCGRAYSGLAAQCPFCGTPALTAT